MKKLIIITFVLGVAACSKEAKKLQDTGPQFNITSGEIKLNGLGTSAEVPLKRGDSDFGPLVEISTEEPQKVQKSERSLICGNLVFQGKTQFNHAPSIFAFKITNREFPGIDGLPSNTHCILSVKLENINGSTVKKEFPVKLQFDVSQKLDVQRIVPPRGLYAPHSDGDILMDKIVIKNPHHFAVGIKYLSQMSCTVFSAFQGSVNPYPGMHSYNLTPKKIKVEGIYSNLEGDFSNFITFLLPPAATVTLTAYGKMQPTNALDSGLSANVPQFGVCFDQCTNPYDIPSLYLSNDVGTASGNNDSQMTKYYFPTSSIGSLPGLNTCR